MFPVLTEAFRHGIRPRPKQYASRWPKSGVHDFCLTSLPIDVAKQHKVRVFGEVKSPKKIGYARNGMERYLESELDLNAVAIPTDGFDCELWVGHIVEGNVCGVIPTGVQSSYSPCSL